MYYLMWKVLAGLHSEAAMSFLLMGHTKFAPDWCFGLMKQYYWQTKVGDLDDIANFVSLSLTIDVPQLVRSLDGTIYCMFQHITGINFLMTRYISPTSLPFLSSRSWDSVC